MGGNERTCTLPKVTYLAATYALQSMADRFITNTPDFRTYPNCENRTCCIDCYHCVCSLPTPISIADGIPATISFTIPVRICSPSTRS
jgi:hypothetical protein